MNDRENGTLRIPRDAGPPALRLRLWLESGGERMLGLDRIRLLEQVGRLGSLNRAAKALGVSYRGAWGGIAAAEKLLGRPLLIRNSGRRGSGLTPFAGELIRSFGVWHREVEDFALRRGRELLPWHIRGGEDDGLAKHR